VVRKFSLALVLMAMAGVASASEGDFDHDKGDFGHDKCIHILWLTFGCEPSERPKPVTAPEIDPASAIAGFTMLAGGLAVLRGRRRINSKD
jgi:hypothetical protein